MREISLVPVLLEPFWHLFRAAETQLTHRLQIRVYIFHAAQTLNECLGGFFPHPWHAGNVVRLVTHQGQEIHHPLWTKTVFLLYPRLIQSAAGHVIDQRHMLVNQLRHILIAGGYHHIPARFSRLPGQGANDVIRSEEHTSELQSRGHLVCRLLLEKKKKVFSSYKNIDWQKE